jgi:NAD(P)-dependent dehydrogenase (short-subunit alcohol dehydrogenase family)
MAIVTGKLDGKVALITGVGNRMGCAMAKMFVDEGAKVIAVDNSKNMLMQWEDMENVIPLLADITKQEDIERMVSKVECHFGRLDALCNITGNNDPNHPFYAADNDQWDHILGIDLETPLQICRRAIPIMTKGGGGSVVNIGSYAPLRRKHSPSFSTAKAGLVGLTKSIAHEYGKQGIRCNIIHPGGSYANHDEYSDCIYHTVSQVLPINWHGQVENIARKCLFLCCDNSNQINGAEITVAGNITV